MTFSTKHRKIPRGFDSKYNTRAEQNVRGVAIAIHIEGGGQRARFETKQRPNVACLISFIVQRNLKKKSWGGLFLFYARVKSIVA